MARLLNYGQPINWGSPLNRGLVSRWQVVPWYASGPRWVDLARRNHGTLTNGPIWSGAKGRKGGYGSITFDGTNDYVLLGAPPALALPGDLTLACWTYVASSFLASKYIVSDFNAGGTISNGSLRTSSSGLFVWFQTGGSVVLTSSTTRTADRWYHVTIVRDDSAKSVKFYIDGKSDGSGSYTGSPTAQQGRYIGTSAPAFPSDCLAGSLDAVTFYNRALSASQVQQLYLDDCAGNPRILNWLRTPVALPPPTLLFRRSLYRRSGRRGVS